MNASSDSEAPASILIVGGGVFGLSTAYELTKRTRFATTHITLLDAFGDVQDSTLQTKAQDANGSSIPSSASSSSAEPASYDVNRIIRADYPYPIYSSLAQEAQELWRHTEWGADDRYQESGLCLSADSGNKGAKYVADSLANVRKGEAANVQELNSAEEIHTAMRAHGLVKGTGVKGYLNRRSGWADASSCMKWLRAKVVSTNRVHFVHGEAAGLMLTDPGTNPAKTVDVSGVELTTGEQITADLTVLATGAWTGQFVDLRGIASARGQCMMYIPVPHPEAKKLQDMPVHLNLSEGCFFFPPKDGEVKVARHAYGYANSLPLTDTRACRPPLMTSTRSTDEADLRVSLPAFPPAIPGADAEVLKRFLSKSIPSLDVRINKAESHSRMCWYLDTGSGDFIVCYPPLFHGSSHRTSERLFLATGGSGHAFKFLPVLGKKVVDVLDGTDQREANGVFTKKWSWPSKQDPSLGDEVWCFDGSRGGEAHLELADALKRSTHT